jgi:hypothetical protein
MVFVTENLTRGQLRDTAVVLKFFDELFDSVNATILLPTTRKPLKCVASETSDHLQFWRKARKPLRNMYFKKEGSAKKEGPLSLKYWWKT